MIRTRDRLQQFSNVFDAAAQLGAFNTLNAQGKDSTKQAMMTALNNWCDRLDVVENFSGAHKFADPFTMIGGNVVGTLAKKGVPQNFSNDIGGVASTNISTLILSSYYQSYGLSYIAKLEGMTDPKTIYTFQQFRAANDFGVYEAGDLVTDPRMSPDPMLQVTGNGISMHTKEITGASVGASVEFNMPIRIGTVDMYIQETGKTEWIKVGFDKPDGYNKGKIFSRINAAESMDIDYTKGKITVTGAATLNNVEKIKFEAAYDSTKDSTQAYTPTLYSTLDNIELNAMQYQFTLEQNLEDIIHMNKMYAYNKPGGVASSYAQNTISKLTEIYVRNLDTNIMTTLATPYLPHMASLKENQVFDLTGWTAGGDMNLFEGRMYEMFAHLDITMANQANSARPTCLVVDSVGAITLMTNRAFKRQGAGVSTSDGFVGTLYGLPIIKSRVLDTFSQERYKTTKKGTTNPLNIYDQLKDNLAVDPTSGDAVSIGFACHRDPGNKDASVIVGNHIVPWCTASMPSHNGAVIRHSIMTEYATKLMVSQYAMPFVMKVSAHPFYNAPDVKIY